MKPNATQQPLKLKANQNSAGKLRQQFTLERLTAHFGVDDETVEA
ncbi:hypothetical protein [Arthrobacter sp. H14]|nr:hypothetical protein [Arthrobacter sp. H14]